MQLGTGFGFRGIELRTFFVRLAGHIRLLPSLRLARSEREYILPDALPDPVWEAQPQPSLVKKYCVRPAMYILSRS